MPSSTNASAPGLAFCSAADLVPRIAEFVVSQGAPAYARLARGKEGVGRVHLANPTTCHLRSSQAVTPTAATITVDNGDGSPANFASYNPLSGALGNAVEIDSTHDPVFHIPKEEFAPGNTTAAFTMNVTLVITYTRKDGSTTTTGLTTSTSAANAVKSVSVDRKTNAIRVLLVPMGDPSAATGQWPAAAQQMVQTGATAMSRYLPVPTGTGDLGAAATGGVRYDRNSGLLDAKSLGLYASDGKACISGANWSTSQVSTGAFAGLTLKGLLAQTLSDWNTANPDRTADLVLGVISDTISHGSVNALNLTCDDGRAATPVSGAPGAAGWVRIVHSSSPSPSPGLIGMEGPLHQTGISSDTLSKHDPNAETDASAPNRVYNTTQKKVLHANGSLNNDHSVMNFNSPYTGDNTVLRARDWDDMLCNLGGVANVSSTSCPIASAIGTTNGVAAGTTKFVINGTIQGGSVTAVDSYFTARGDDTVLDAASSLQLRFLDGSNTVLATHGIPILTGVGHAPGGTTLDSPDLFHAVVPFDTATVKWELLLGGVVKVSRSIPAASAAPDVTDTTTSPFRLLRSFQPFEGGNGRTIIFDGTHLYVNRVSDPQLTKVSLNGEVVGTRALDHSPGAGAYRASTDEFLLGSYEGGAFLSRVSKIARTAAEPTTTALFTFDFVSRETKFCGTGGPQQVIDGLAYNPETNKLGLGDDATDKFFVTGLDGAVLQTIVTSGDAVYKCRSGIAWDGATGWWISLLKPESPATKIVHVTAAGAFDQSFTIPGYWAEDLEYIASGLGSGVCGLGMNEAIGLAPVDVRIYQIPCGGASPPAETTNVTFTGTQTGVNPTQLVGRAYTTCGGATDPFHVAASGLRPVEVNTTTGEAIFSFTYSTRLTCASGTPELVVAVSNGLYSSALTDQDADAPLTPAANAPVVALVSPLNNQRYRIGQKAALLAEATDAEQGNMNSAIQWTIDGVSVGTGPSLDVTVPATPGSHTVTAKVTDATSLIGQQSVTIIVSADNTPPSVTLSLPANGNAPWNKDAPGLVDVSASDGGSGLAFVTCSLDGVPLVVPPVSSPSTTYVASLSITSNDVQAVSCTASDVDGNEETANAVIQNDFTDPTVTPVVTPNPVLVNGTATAAAGAADAISGVATASCPAVPTGTAGPGQSVLCTATDVAGNSATASALYDVVFASGTPCVDSLSNVVMPPIKTDGTSVLKGVVPVKFRSCDANAMSIGGTTQIVEVGPRPVPPAGCSAAPPSTSRAPVFCSASEGTSAAEADVFSNTPDTNFRWSPDGQYHIFNLDTNNLQSGKKYKYYIPLTSGQNIFFEFTKK